MSSPEVIPTAWLPVIELLGFIAVIITVLGTAVKITRHITKFEGNTHTEITRLDGRINTHIAELNGRINVAEERLDNTREIVKILREQGTLFYKTGEKIEGSTDVKPK